MTEYLDAEGYPTDAALERVRNFEGTPKQVHEFLGEIWQMIPLGQPEPFVDDWDRPSVKLEMVTAGWSGNESIIAALDDSMFWMYGWYASLRGGAFEFRFTEEQWETWDLLPLNIPSFEDRLVGAKTEGQKQGVALGISLLAAHLVEPNLSLFADGTSGRTVRNALEAAKRIQAMTADEFTDFLSDQNKSFNLDTDVGGQNAR